MSKTRFSTKLAVSDWFIEEEVWMLEPLIPPTLTTMVFLKVFFLYINLGFQVFASMKLFDVLMVTLFTTPASYYLFFYPSCKFGCKK